MGDNFSNVIPGRLRSPPLASASASALRRFGGREREGGEKKRASRAPE